jgi:hypothetical protein
LSQFFFLKDLSVTAVSVHCLGEGRAKKTQRYNPELPILQGPAFHIFVKHVSHVIRLEPGDRDSRSGEQLLAGAETTRGIRGCFRKAGGRRDGPLGHQMGKYSLRLAHSQA